MSENSKAGRFKVVIDKAACCGYGICAEICPDIYKLDAGGMVYVEEPIVPQGLEEKAREGAEACPQSALAIEPI
ncbi:MAG: ferredoxin [Alphaproteobacteria bacterium]|nr:ferredoxin [Alphaproteobacteria bacterium]